MKNLIIFVTALIVLNFGASAAFADDMWRETPSLENLKPASLIGEPSRMSNKPPTVDMWAETPTLDRNNDTLDFFNDTVVIKSGLADPELYAETPDRKNVSPVKKNRRSPDDVMVAEQNERGTNRQ